MKLTEWLDAQGYPHGMECVGVARLQQLWDQAQEVEREACAKVMEDAPFQSAVAAYAIRARVVEEGL